MRTIRAFILGLIIITVSGLTVWTDAARAVDLKVLSISGMAPVLSQLIPEFEKTTDQRVSAEYGTPAVIRDRLLKEEQFDVVFSASSAWDDLIKANKVETGLPLAKFGLSVAIRQGAPKPDLHDVGAFKKALLDAQSIAIGDPRSGGPAAFLHRVFERLGVAEQLAAKLKSYPNGASIAQAVARGEAEIGIIVTPDLMVAPGVDVAAPLPSELQIVVTVMGGVAIGTPNSEAARAFIEFVHRPTSADAFKSKGLDPIF